MRKKKYRIIEQLRKSHSSWGPWKYDQSTGYWEGSGVTLKAMSRCCISVSGLETYHTEYWFYYDNKSIKPQIWIGLMTKSLF